ncbi:PTS sugar transporter subunit IIC [Bombilactobacillus bombi]|uniref:PTS sugar transporter subunit IIC n=1 Tax=Bombilactobacillus bombi TaxID=1303590 RepID=A0A3R6XSZ2_9LACO|nr:PTS sugar transporter subunit IIC [Bombilactobacillus bombi]RHW48222.1 PTS sugar transporter subunit IIC [Bombilactobacillus bombi]
MGMSFLQASSITLLAYIYNLDRHATQFFGKMPILYGAITGMILGDVKTGLMVGATLQLMSLGVANIGGSSMPDYIVAAIISAAISVTTGKGIAAGMAIGLPVGMLTMNLDVIVKLINSAIAKKTQTFANRKQFGKMQKMIPIATFMYPLEAALPVFLAVVFGKTVVESILNFMPQWFTVGLNVAGGMLPAVGIAMLLVYMPMKRYGYWIIIGFVLSAFLKMPVLGVALLGCAAAVNQFKNENTHNTNVTAPMANLNKEDMEDE